MVELSGRCRCGTTGPVATLFDAFQSPSACYECTKGAGSHQDSSHLHPGTSSVRQTGGRAKTHHTDESLYDILAQIRVSSLTNITRTPMWLESPDLRFIRLDDKHLQCAIQVLTEQMCNSTTLDYVQLYSKTNPLFDAPHENVSQ